jgi:hypothetical protein
MSIAITPFNMVRDINGFNGFGLVQTNNMWATTLVANAEQHFTVPPYVTLPYKHLLAIFTQSPGSSIFVAINATAALPGGSFSQVTAELNPGARLVNSGDVISVITPDASDYFEVLFYATT